MRVDLWTAEIVAALADAGIRPILLKGPAIVRWLYPDDPWRRSYCDADLLVGPGDRMAARDVLVGRGLAPSAHPRLEADGHHALSFVREVDGATVDLHHSLHGMLDVPAERIWTAAQRDAATITVAAAGVAVLGPAMRLLLVALHLGAHDGPGDQAWVDLTRAFAVATAAEWEAVLALAEQLDVAHELAARLSRRGEAAALVRRLGPQPPAMRYWLVAAVDAGRAPTAALAIDRLMAADGMAPRIRYARAKLAVSAHELAPPAAWVLARTGSLSLARGAHAVILAGRLPRALGAWGRVRSGRP
jgi:hypothetical protein